LYIIDELSFIGLRWGFSADQDVEGELMSKVWRAPAALLVVLALVAAACSSDDSSGGGSEGTLDTEAAQLSEGGSWEAPGVEVAADDLECGTTAENPQRGVTDDSVKVGGLLTLSGATTALYTDAEVGARVRFERANAEGGVHGRTIDFAGAEDDGMESARQVDAARRLVDEEVFAVVPLLSAIPSWRDTFCEAVMPTFGWAFTAAWCGTTTSFGITGCLVNPDRTYNSIAVGAIVEALEGTDNTIALIGNEDEAAQIGQQKTADALERYGVEVVYSENILSPTSPIADASPVVNDITTSNDGAPPAMVYQITDFSNTSAITQALVAAGYEGKLLNAVGYDPRLAEFEGFDGSLVNLQWAPFESTDVDFVQQMNADFDEYAADANRGLPAAGGYIAADMFLAALEETGPDLTVESFLQTLNGGWTYSTPGFRGDVTFPMNHVISSPCANLVELSGGEYSAATPIVCNQPFEPDGG
jgi:ABC-type branched-subunit amino acid transport system substrate-binding protein